MPDYTIGLFTPLTPISELYAHDSDWVIFAYVIWFSILILSHLDIFFGSFKYLNGDV